MDVVLYEPKRENLRLEFTPLFGQGWINGAAAAQRVSLHEQVHNIAGLHCCRDGRRDRHWHPDRASRVVRSARKAAIQPAKLGFRASLDCALPDDRFRWLACLETHRRTASETSLGSPDGVEFFVVANIFCAAKSGFGAGHHYLSVFDHCAVHPPRMASRSVIRHVVRSLCCMGGVCHHSERIHLLFELVGCAIWIDMHLLSEPQVALAAHWVE